MHQTTLKNISIKIFISLDGSKRIDILNVSEPFTGRVAGIKSNVNLQQSVTCYNNLAGLYIMKDSERLLFSNRSIY